jgi:hypothetical protein
LTIEPAVAGLLNLPEVIDYFSPNGHRMAAFRATLDLLNIPLPDWAVRGISGRAAARRNTIAAFRQDNPETLHQATMRKVADHAAKIPAGSDTDPLNFLR